MSPSEYLAPFFAVWISQGAINAIHVRIAMQEVDSKVVGESSIEQSANQLGHLGWA